MILYNFTLICPNLDFNIYKKYINKFVTHSLHNRYVYKHNTIIPTFFKGILD
jgi:hypothetical protein